MKKVLLFAVALCCMMSVTAQRITQNPSLKDRVKRVEQLNRNTEAYTQKLDSLCSTDGLIKIFFQYDNQYNIQKAIVKGMGMIVSSEEYFYDAQGRCISVIRTGMNGSEKVDYTYNAQGWVALEMHYDLENNQWDEESKIEYQYDNNGNVLVAIEQEDEEGIGWVNDEKLECTYQNGKMVMEITYDWFGAWVEYRKTELTYDVQGDCIMALYSEWYSGAWEIDEKNVYAYDNNHNCVRDENYDYDVYTATFELEDVIEFTFDLTVPIDVIAGLDYLSDAIVSINNKVVSVKETQYEDGFPTSSMEFALYYSAITSVSETTEASLNLWPNPACETLSVQAEGLQQVDIFTLEGRHVATVENGFESINVSALSTGCYVMKATMKDGRVSIQKFVKK